MATELLFRNAFWNPFEAPLQGAGAAPGPILGLDKDNSGNGYDFTALTGTADTANEKFGNSCVAFAAASSQYGTIADTADLEFDNGNSYTIEVWLRATDATPAAKTYICSKGSGTGSSAYNWEIYLNTDGTVSFVVGDGSGIDSYISTSTLSDNTWLHLACVWDTSDDKQHMFFDNVEEGVGAVSSAIPLKNAIDIWVGARNNGGGDLFWDGQMDEMVFSNEAKTTFNITGEYSAGGNIKGLWHFNTA